MPVPFYLKATFGDVMKSIEYHLANHGKEGMSAVEYTQCAVKNFEHTGAVIVKTTDSQGRAALKVTSEFGMGLYTPEGKIIWFQPK